MRRAEIEEQNHLLERQRQFRLAADIVTDAWMAFPEAWAIAVINKRVEGFAPRADLLAPAAHAMLYRRDDGRLRSALDLPATDEAGRP
jgi:hypothetical protein